MIPAAPGTTASFARRQTNGTYQWSKLPVVAWDDDGDALIVGHTNRLVKATSLHIDLLDIAVPEIGAVIPGGGWIATLNDGWTTPVVGWAEHDGFFTPLVVIDRDHLEPIAAENLRDLTHPLEERLPGTGEQVQNSELQSEETTT